MAFVCHVCKCLRNHYALLSINVRRIIDLGLCIKWSVIRYNVVYMCIVCRKIHTIEKPSISVAPFVLCVCLYVCTNVHCHSLSLLFAFETTSSISFAHCRRSSLRCTKNAIAAHKREWYAPILNWMIIAQTNGIVTPWCHLCIHRSLNVPNVNVKQERKYADGTIN